MHEASTPEDRTHLKRGSAFPNDEDGRVVQSIAEIPTIEFQAARMAPSGTMPAVTNRQIAMSSLRASAMIAIRRVRP